MDPTATIAQHAGPYRRAGSRRRSLLVATAVGFVTVVSAGVVAPAGVDADTGAIGDPTTSSGTTTTTTPDTVTSTTVTPGRPTNDPAPPPAPPAPAPPPATPTTTISSTDTTPATTVAPPTTPAPAPQRVIAYPSQIAHILATIRYLESRGDYLAPPNKGRASGAYQFIRSTWDNYGGYPDAYLAPPEVQDERAAADVARFLTQWNNDVSMIPVMWYYPLASRDASLMDVVPVPSAGNVLTVREYQQRWLAVWAFLSGRPIPTPLTLGDQLARAGFAPLLPPQLAVDPATPAAERTATVAFPVLGPTRLAAPECDVAPDGTQTALAGASPDDLEAAGLCAEQAPGIVFGVKMQPVLSVADGVVTAVRDVVGAPISVTVTDVLGRSYELSGFNDDTPGTDDGAAPAHLRLTSLARVGQSVRAGQILGFMGDSEPLPLGIRSDVPTDATVQIPVDAVAPHIRLTIADLDGTPVDAYGPVIDALFRQVCSVGIGPWSVVPNGLGQESVITETTDDRPDIDSEWVVTEAGEVIASGWAAMIHPSESCGWAPAEKRGPGAGGPTSVPVEWMTPIVLPTSIWVDLALREDTSPDTPIARP